MWGEALANTREMLCDVKHCDENCGDIGQNQENLGGEGCCVTLGRLWGTFRNQENNKSDRDIDKMLRRC